MGSTLGEQLSSVAGIVAATLILVRVALKFLATVKFARALPQWVYAVCIAGLLTLFARFVLQSVQGNAWDLCYQSVMAAAAATGFHNWIDDFKTPLHESAGIDIDGDGTPDVVDVIDQPTSPATPPAPPDDGSMKLE